ncbi:hypothetical protein F2Q69_00034479 [Brassica cretica]|uniref:Uncharacterized protein n=1 Tax=Brassica cretica TaxID=69181 RepID=A0A8S9SAM4_BRACR|nr:hypothetical protein F2Q69_00034479 [Brassica cretica]
MPGLMLYRRFRRARSLRNDRAEQTLGRYIATELGSSSMLEYWQRDKFWDLVSRFLILCLEMLETSALGLGQDLDDAAQPWTLADYNRPDRYYTNKLW